MLHLIGFFSSVCAPKYWILFKYKSCYQSMQFDSKEPTSPCFVFHIRGFDGVVRAYRLLHLPFGWNAAPVICQRRTTSAIVPKAKRAGASALVYMDDALVYSRYRSTTEKAASEGAIGLRENSGRS